MIRSPIALIFFLSVLLGSSPAWAYVPPSNFIARSVLKKHDLGKGLRVQSQVNAYEGDRALGVTFRQTTIFNPQNGQLRSWATDVSGQVLYVIERAEINQLSPLAALLIAPPSAEALHVLQRGGVPVNKADSGSLARWKSTLAWVIGPRGASPAELWVEKDTFLPLRLVFSESKARRASEIEFENYRFHKEYPYPRSISQYRVIGEGKEKTSELTLKDEATEVAVNVELNWAKAPTGSGFTDAGLKATEPVRELLRKYYEFAR